jgi:NADPH:quinone reductase
MHAIQITRNGEPDVLDHVEVEDPSPGPGQVLVDVAAIGINFIDTYQRRGIYEVPLPAILGSEGSGTIVEVGEGVTSRQVGDRVAWWQAPASYASRVVVDAEQALRVPEGIDDDIAAALPLQGITAHYLTHSTKRLDSEDTVLAYAAAGGVGRLLVQLALRRGARVLACTSTDAKEADVRSLGVDEVIRYRDVDIAETVRELTDGQGVDVVYDSVGKDTFEASLDCLKPRGLMVLYGASSGPVPPVDLQILNRKGSLYVTRPSLGAYASTPDELEWRAGALFDLVTSGQLDVAIHDRYPLAEAERAHRDLESGTTSGKLLLVP